MDLKKEPDDYEEEMLDIEPVIIIKDEVIDDDEYVSKFIHIVLVFLFKWFSFNFHLKIYLLIFVLIKIL